MLAAMARLVGPAKLSVHSAGHPEQTLSVTLLPTRGDLVRVTVEDLRGGSPALVPRGPSATPVRALGLVPMSRVERLVAELQDVCAAATLAPELAEADLVLHATLPLADGTVEITLREDERALPLRLAYELLQDFVVQVVTLAETRTARFDRREGGPPRATWIWLRPLLIVALIGTGGYLLGAYLQRLFGCAP